MPKNALCKKENEVQTIDSREVAEMMGVEHKELLRTIRVHIKNLTEGEVALSKYFRESTYKDSTGRKLPKYDVTKRGCEYIAHKMQGVKGAVFTDRYMDKFDAMEKALKEQSQPQSMSMEDIIIYQMQQSKLMKEQLEQTQTVAIEAKATAEQATKQMEIVKDAMLLDHDSWRKDCNNIINKVAKERGGTREAYREVRDEVYYIVQQRAGANLKQRVINKQDRMRREGIAKSTIDKVCQIDVIAEDKRLKEIYIAVVKEMAVKYGVN